MSTRPDLHPLILSVDWTPNGRFQSIPTTASRYEPGSNGSKITEASDVARLRRHAKRLGCRVSIEKAAFGRLVVCIPIHKGKPIDRPL